MSTVRSSAILSCLLLGAAPSAIGQGIGEISERISRNIRADLVKPRLEVTHHSGETRYVSMGAHERLLTVVMEDDTVRLWDLNEGVQLAVIRGSEGAPSVAAPVSDGLAVVVGDVRGKVSIFDLEDGTHHTLGMQQGAIQALAISRDDRVLVTASTDGQVVAWSVKTREQIAVFAGDRMAVTAIGISADGSRVATGSADGSVRIGSTESGQEVSSPIRLAGAVRAIELLDDGHSIVVGTSDGVIETLDIASGTRLRRIDAPRRGLIRLAISRDGNHAVTVHRDGVLRVFDLAEAKQPREMKDHDLGVGTIALLSGGRHLLTSGANGTSQIWDLRTGQPLLRLIHMTNGWAVIGRHGRFDGSEQGIGNLSWETSEGALSLDRFSEEYFEPGLLASYLNDDAEFAIPNPVTIEDGIPQPPLLLIASIEPAADGKLIVAATAEDRGGGIESLRLYHNGKLVPAASLLEQRDIREGNQHIRGVGFILDYLPGPNSFKLIATGKRGIESESPRLTKVLEGKTPASTLHIAAIGVNRYKDPALYLNYSVPDARAISAQLGRDLPGPFAEIRNHLVLDEQATRVRILELLDSFSATRPEDVIVVYLGGHGLVVDGEWYFLPHESSYGRDPSKVHTYLSATRIQEALVAAKAQRILLMIDSCYSGAGVLSFQKHRHFQRRFLRSLSRIAGVTVLAATRQDQRAGERAELGHGMFTYVVLNGLEGKADTNPKDGQITAHELVAHAVDAMPTLSRRFFLHRAPQEPMAFALGADFLLQTNVVAANP